MKIFLVLLLHPLCVSWNEPGDLIGSEFNVRKILLWLSHLDMQLPILFLHIAHRLCFLQRPDLLSTCQKIAYLHQRDFSPSPTKFVLTCNYLQYQNKKAVQVSLPVFKFFFNFLFSMLKNGAAEVISFQPLSNSKDLPLDVFQCHCI